MLLLISLFILQNSYGQSDLLSVELGFDGEVREVKELGFDRNGEETARLNVSITNHRDDSVEMYWMNFEGNGVPHSTKEMRSWIGHQFYFTPIESGGFRDIVLDEVVLEEWAGFINAYNLSNATEHDRKRESLQFQREYYQREGRRWSNYWTRDPVPHHYHQVEHREIIKMSTNRSQFHQCKHGQLSTKEIATLDDLMLKSNHSVEMKNSQQHFGRTNDGIFCRDKVMGHSSGFEEALAGMGSGMPSQHINSRTAWLSKNTSFVIDNIIHRAADMVNIPLHTLTSSMDLRLTHYVKGGYYREHHDYQTQYRDIRYITFLMYLNDVKQGGNTSFPKADEKCLDQNGYFGIQPIKGSALFFYNLLADGNVDVRTAHCGEESLESVKWVLNLGIRDKFNHG